MDACHKLEQIQANQWQLTGENAFLGCWETGWGSSLTSLPACFSAQMRFQRAQRPPATA